MLVQGPNHLTTKHTNRTIALTTDANPPEKAPSEMNINVEFNSASQGDTINNISNLEDNNDSSRSTSNDTNESDDIEIENYDRNNVDVDIEVEVDIENSNSKNFNNEIDN